MSASRCWVFLGFFGADGWVGMLSLLVFTTGGVAVSVSLLLSYSYWLSSSAMFALTTAS